MANYVDDYAPLAGVASAVQGFAESYERAQDRQYKNIEREAQVAALKSKQERDAFENSLSQRKQKTTLELLGKNRDARFDEQGNLVDAPLRQDYIDMEQAKSERDPFGLKAQNAANAGKPKEFEYAAAGFGRRMEGAEKKLENLLTSGFDPTSKKSQLGSYLGGPLERAKNPSLKKFEQIKNDFISAVLRKESGASISPAERAAEEKKYFHQPGDTPDVLEQKAQSRAQALAAMRAQSGGAWGLVPGVMIGAPKSALPKGKLPTGQLSAAPKAPPPPPAPIDLEAIAWAEANPKDPRSAAILKANGR